ncbi:hypothetical protein T492DRAFT_48516 [Pavlovales sp. CCMP2436]|nr:hypothetical protein T492DRAFT_48516 [Pavlovales sp. CCMP2436]
MVVGLGFGLGLSSFNETNKRMGGQGSGARQAPTIGELHVDCAEHRGACDTVGRHGALDGRAGELEVAPPVKPDEKRSRPEKVKHRAVADRGKQQLERGRQQYFPAPFSQSHVTCGASHSSPPGRQPWERAWPLRRTLSTRRSSRRPIVSNTRSLWWLHCARDKSAAAGKGEVGTSSTTSRIAAIGAMASPDEGSARERTSRSGWSVSGGPKFDSGRMVEIEKPAHGGGTRKHDLGPRAAAVIPEARHTLAG